VDSERFSPVDERIEAVADRRIHDRAIRPAGTARFPSQSIDHIVV
jgi:hypothetical protein